MRIKISLLLIFASASERPARLAARNAAHLRWRSSLAPEIPMGALPFSSHHIEKPGNHFPWHSFRADAFNTKRLKKARWNSRPGSHVRISPSHILARSMAKKSNYACATWNRFSTPAPKRPLFGPEVRAEKPLFAFFPQKTARFREKKRAYIRGINFSWARRRALVWRWQKAALWVEMKRCTRQKDLD